jgi:F-box protein, helicase, 18
MQFTEEQEAVISSGGDIKVNAVAGSGKTTALIEYARRQPARSRILYLAFNRSVRIEAQGRFSKAGLPNVDVQTAHSLAYRRVAAPNGYTVSNGYRVHEIAQLLAIRPVGKDPLSSFLIAHHVMKLASLFCNSTARKVQDLDYCATLSDPHALAAVKRYYNHIEKGARLFLAKMDKKEIGVTHDFYLKKFQLSRPILNYDVILFDEGQDASAVMLDVFLAQKATKVIVGDMHQQIYGWRHAINALKSVRFADYALTTSFRFNEHIARLAVECLRWKSLLGETALPCIRGIGNNKTIKTRATIARTNLALLKVAIDAVEYDRAMKKLYFEGNINSYTYAADGASIYDVLNLYLGKKDRVRDPLIAGMAGFAQLTEYAETSEDMELLMLIDIVEAYGARIPQLLKKVTALHVDDGRREEADMIFSTLHRCKGMEYDSVTLTDDFINEERVKKLLTGGKEKPVDRQKLSEEINLAYVAVTRSRNFLDFPRSMFPDADKNDFAKIKLPVPLPKTGRLKKTWPLADHRKKYSKAYAPWTPNEDEELRKQFIIKGASLSKIALHFDRNIGAIRSRLKKMGLLYNEDTINYETRR